ncbi:MAG TPA: histidine kinase [Terriglobia bacterium]|nr:histidine kinase [Terriglobia bacterium]
MGNGQAIESGLAGHHTRKRLWIAGCWILIVLIFATQWYAYDAGHGIGDPFIDYVGWSCYLWGVLTPLVLWFVRRHPIKSNSWKKTVPLHVAASFTVGFLDLSFEAMVEWLRASSDWPLREAMRHYLSQHLEISVLTYWMLLAAMQFYRLHEDMQARRIHEAQLEARLTEAKLQALRMQLQPHFLFNTLQAATVLIHDDPDAAEDVLLCLSELLRVCLSELNAQEIPLSREIEFLDHYLRIQQRRFGDRLRFELSIDSELATCAVPTLVLQPLVENAIRHGIGKHKQSDVVSIRGFVNQGRLSLEIRNQGGKLNGAPERLLTQGVGLSNTRARLEQLYGEEQSLQIFNLEPAGVCVRISIPIRRILPQAEVKELELAR